MNQNFDIALVKNLLNRSLTELDRATLTRLGAARQRALCAHPGEVSVSLLAGDGHRSHSEHPHHRIQQWGLIVLLVISMFSCVSYWQHLSDPSDSEVDIAILLDDLPVEMYAN